MPSFPVIHVDTEGIGKGVEKLADLAKSLGVLAFGPGHTVRMAKADSEAMQIRAEGEVEVAGIQQRAVYRLTQEALRSQENIEAIYNQAVGFLPKTVSEEPVSPDWAAKFHDRARFASDEELRTIWAKLLVSEVARPRSISARTLQLLDGLSPEDARSLESVLACAAEVGNNQRVLVRAGKGSKAEGSKSLFGVDYVTFENLRAAGFISSADDTLLASEYECILVYGQKVLRLTQSPNNEIRLPVYLLTAPAREIARSLGLEPNETFLDKLSEWAPTQAFQISCIFR